METITYPFDLHIPGTNMLVKKKEKTNPPRKPPPPIFNSLI